jgi:hypothetical protein
MKNYYVAIFIMMQLWNSTLFAQVTTPNGTQIDYIIHSEGNIALFEAQAAQWLNDRGWTSLVTKIGPATAEYNCHAYAWYKSEGGSNNYWINAFLNSDLNAFNPYSYSSTPPAPNNINKYWNDCSYVEVDTEDEATKVWFSSCWQWTGYEWYNPCDHSAVRLPSGLYESKWGAWPLYRHPADKCPYIISNRRYFKRGPYITGPSLVCNTSTTFSLDNLPPNYFVTWDQSYYLTYVSGQGTANYTVKATGPATSGEGWVQASITGECGTLVLRKDIWVGIPQKPSHIVFVPHTPCTNQFVLAYFNEINPPISQVYYQWSSGDHVFFPQGESSTWFQTKGPLAYTTNVHVSAQNICGSNILTQLLTVQECGGGLFSVGSGFKQLTTGGCLGFSQV